MIAIINDLKYGNIELNFTGFMEGTFKTNNYWGNFTNDRKVNFTSKKKAAKTHFASEFLDILDDYLKRIKCDILPKKDVDRLEENDAYMRYIANKINEINKSQISINKRYLKKLDKNCRGAF